MDIAARIVNRLDSRFNCGLQKTAQKVPVWFPLPQPDQFAPQKNYPKTLLLGEATRKKNEPLFVSVRGLQILA
jgi:hypothetical protein